MAARRRWIALGVPSAGAWLASICALSGQDDPLLNGEPLAQVIARTQKEKPTEAQRVAGRVPPVAASPPRSGWHDLPAVPRRNRQSDGSSREAQVSFTATTTNASAPSMSLNEPSMSDSARTDAHPVSTGSRKANQ
jgi:hypothetical protein